MELRRSGRDLEEDPAELSLPRVRWVFWSLSWRSDIERGKEEYVSGKSPLINRNPQIS